MLKKITFTQLNWHNMVFAMYGFFLLILPAPTFAHTVLVDRTIATINREIILESELEEMYKQYLYSTHTAEDPLLKKKLLRDLIWNKIFCIKAKEDNHGLVPKKWFLRETEKIITSWISHFGSEEGLVRHFHQPFGQIKKNIQRRLKEQHLVGSMHQLICQDVSISPEEVKSYFESLFHEKHNYLPTSFHVQQLVIYPKIAVDRERQMRSQLLAYKTQFCSKSITSLVQALEPGVNVDFVGTKDEWVAFGTMPFDYESVVRILPIGGISLPVRSTDGYYLIQLLGRNQSKYRACHIFKPLEPTQEEIQEAKDQIFKIRSDILEHKYSFQQAIERYALDQPLVMSQNLVRSGNPITGKLIFADELDPAIYFTISDLPAGSMAEPQYIKTGSRFGWNLLYLNEKNETHQVSLARDYDRVYTKLLKEKKQKVIDVWLNSQKNAFSIDVVSDYQDVMELL